MWRLPASVTTTVAVIGMRVCMSVAAIIGAIVSVVVGAIDPASRHPQRARIVARSPDIVGPRACRSVDYGCRSNAHGNANLRMRGSSGNKGGGGKDQCIKCAF